MVRVKYINQFAYLAAYATKAVLLALSETPILHQIPLVSVERKCASNRGCLLEPNFSYALPELLLCGRAQMGLQDITPTGW